MHPLGAHPTFAHRLNLIVLEIISQKHTMEDTELLPLTPATVLPPSKEISILLREGEGYKFSVTTEAAEAKAKLIEASGKITTVDAGSLELAQLTVKSLAALRIQVEKARKEVKAPVLELADEIDAHAKGFVNTVLFEESRLSKEIGIFSRQQEEIRQEAIRKAQKAAQEASELKAQAERAAEAAKAPPEPEAKPLSFAERARLAADQEELAQKAEAATQSAQQATQAAISLAPVAGVKSVLTFEVEDIVALYRAHPELVTLTVKTAEVNKRLKQLQANNLPTSIPGLKIITDSKVSTR